MATSAVVGIVGMDALRRDINRAATDVKGPLYAALREAGRRAADPVAARVQSVLPTDERPRGHPGRLRNNVRVRASRTGASVVMGSKPVPYAGWIEFGGTRKQPHESARQYVPNGRYLFPSAQGLAGVAADAYSRELTLVFNNDALWTNTTSDGSQVHD